MKCVILDSKEYVSSPSLIARLYEAFDEVEMYESLPADEAEAYERAKDADAIIFGVMHLSNDFLDRLPKLKIVQFIGTGHTTFVDIPYANSIGIQTLNIEGYGSNAVAEFAIGQIFSACRYSAMGDRHVRAGEWLKGDYEGFEVEGATVGVIGTGHIGEIVAKKLSLLGAKVLGFDLIHKPELIDGYGVEYVDDLKELASRCDIMTLHLTVDASTTRIVGREVIAAMPERSYLINTARAQLVDTDALYDALKSGHLRYATVDVFDEEPPVGNRLLELDNVAFTPHIGFYTKKSCDNAMRMCCDNVVEHLSCCGRDGWR